MGNIRVLAQVVTDKPLPNNERHIVCRCVICACHVHMKVDADEWLQFKMNKIPVQSLSGLDLDDREILVSGICGPCFDSLACDAMSDPQR